jgi:predicted acyl esterase
MIRRWILEVSTIALITGVCEYYLLVNIFPVGIVFLIMISILGVELGFAFDRLSRGNWRVTADFSLCHSESLKIPIDAGVSLGATLYTPYREQEQRNEPFPIIIFAPGFTGSTDIIPWVTLPLVRCGYAVLVYQPRGNGISEGKRSDIVNTIQDVKNVVDFVATKPELDFNRCGVIGHSLGGMAALTHAYNHPRVRLVIGIAAPHDIKAISKGKKTLFQKIIFQGFKILGFKSKYTLQENKLVSPKYFLQAVPENSSRVFLIHAKDDFVNYRTEFLANATAAELPKENTLLFQKGGHDLRGQETVAIAQIIKWIDRVIGKARSVEN